MTAQPALWRRLVAEGVGTGLLVTVVVLINAAAQVIKSAAVRRYG